MSAMDTTWPQRHPNAAYAARLAPILVAFLLPMPVVATFVATAIGTHRATRAMAGKPDVLYYLDGYLIGCALMLVPVGVLSLVLAGTLVRLAAQHEHTGRGSVAVVVWSWLAFLFMFCATRVNPGTGWTVGSSEGDKLVDDYLPAHGYLTTLTVLAVLTAGLCVTGTAALAAGHRGRR
jgi:hypothetical protein